VDVFEHKLRLKYLYINHENNFVYFVVIRQEPIVSDPVPAIGGGIGAGIVVLILILIVVFYLR
jgi:hypothetical protein